MIALVQHAKVENQKRQDGGDKGEPEPERGAQEQGEENGFHDCDLLQRNMRCGADLYRAGTERARCGPTSRQVTVVRGARSAAITWV
jgi:hypothetical protein